MSTGPLSGETGAGARGQAARRLVYLVGLPGCGKSTLLRRALMGADAPFTVGGVITKPFARHYIDPILGTERDATRHMLLGRYDADAAPFFGTDRLSMSVQPMVLQYVQRYQPLTVIGEGDRLANVRFFDDMRWLGYTLTVVHIMCDALTAQNRQIRRDGDAQSEVWRKGRITKLRNLAPWITHSIVNNDDDSSNAVSELRQLLFPV